MMDKNTQQPVAQITGGKTYMSVELLENCPADLPNGAQLYLSTPVPRDVLMALGEEVRSACYDAAMVRQSISGAKWDRFTAGKCAEAVSMVNTVAIADRYASKVQPERQDPLDAVGVVMDLRAWRAVLRGLCVGRELLTPDECAENVRHQLRTAKKAAATQPEPVNQQLLAAARSILVPDMIDLLPPEYVAKVQSAIAAAEAAHKPENNQ